MARPASLRGTSGSEKSLQADDRVARRGIEQLDELPLGRFERRVGHVVDEADLDELVAGDRGASDIRSQPDIGRADAAS